MTHKRRKGILVVFLLVLSIVFLVLIGTEKFGIHKITVLGNTNIEYNEIVKLSGIIPGENIFKLDVKKIMSNLRSNPYISVIKIERRFPDIVVLHIKERKPRAIIEYLGSYIVMDSQGNILEVKKELGNLQYPIITGMKVSAFLVGQRIQSSDPYQIKNLDDILDPIYAHKANTLISKINIEDPDNIYFISREGVLIKVGQAWDMEKKVLLMKEVLAQLAEDDITSGVLDITAGTSASYKPIEQKEESMEQGKSK